MSPQAEIEEADAYIEIKKGRNALFVTPMRTIGVCSGSGGVTEALNRGLQTLEIGSAEHFAANITQAAVTPTGNKSRKVPPRKKSRMINSNSDEEEFQMRIRSARMYMGESSGSVTSDSDSSRSPVATKEQRSACDRQEEQATGKDQAGAGSGRISRDQSSTAGRRRIRSRGGSGRDRI